MKDLSMIGRKTPLFEEDLYDNISELNDVISGSSFLVVGGAGTIGQAVSLELLKRNPRLIHIVDLNENNMVELVRDFRSSEGYVSGDFQTYALDCNSYEFDALVDSTGSYDFILNLSALKHVRSEKDPFTLMRMIDTNIFMTEKLMKVALQKGAKKFFCVSTDKAANPVNMMGASKRIMELYLMRDSKKQTVSTARFANVAFSDGSLLHGFNQRMMKGQPISAPVDIKRYFVTAQEAGELCMFSLVLGANTDIFFPKLSEKLNLIGFADIARLYLESQGFEAYECESEEAARKDVNSLIKKNKWPCYFFESDTTGEKDFEEFYSDDEEIDSTRFKGIGIVKNNHRVSDVDLEQFRTGIANFKKSKVWNKQDLVNLFSNLLPNFSHEERGKYLDSRM